MQKCIFAQRCVAKMHLMLCKNIFLHHILFCKNAFLHQQNVTNAFDAKMHLMRTFCNTKCYKCIFATRTFYEVKCSASHFPKENVQHHIFLWKMFSNHAYTIMAVQKDIFATP